MKRRYERSADIRDCLCIGMSDAGDMAPDMWRCPYHGITGRIRVHMAAERFAEQIHITKEGAMNFFYGLHRNHNYFETPGFFGDPDDSFMWRLNELTTNTKSKPIKNKSIWGRIISYFSSIFDHRKK